MKIHLNLSLYAIGIEVNGEELKGASVQKDFKEPFIKELLPFDAQEDLALVSEEDQIISTAISGRETLVRLVTIPLTSEKDIAAALPFQAETLLPYPIEEAIITHQVLEKSDDSTTLTFFAIRKETLEKELALYHRLGFDPEEVSCLPVALAEFGARFIPSEKKYFLLYLKAGEMSCVLVQKGKVLASYSEPILFPLPIHLNEKETELLQLQRGVIKVCYSLAKEAGGDEIEGIAVTGEVARVEGLSEALVKMIPYPLLRTENPFFSSSQLLEYALPIGLAFAALSTNKEKCNFRQGELAYPTPWKRFRSPLLLFIATMLLFTFAFNFYSKSYLVLKEDQVRQSYLDLLAGMNRSHKLFEESYGQKHPEVAQQFGGDIPDITQLSADQINERLNFLQKELLASPDSFPLFPNTPRVSDVLAWLANHEASVYADEAGEARAKLQIENFNYTMVKRPQLAKKNERYQVKVEFEFSTATPKWAREFHDALIAPNDLVDPKAEVKWSSNRGKYKTSFFLKDKTSYPGS